MTDRKDEGLAHDNSVILNHTVLYSETSSNRSHDYLSLYPSVPEGTEQGKFYQHLPGRISFVAC